MLVTFEGVQGSGKSVSAVGLAYEEHINFGKKVISNNHLNFPYTHFDLEYFLKHIADEELSDCILLLDESYQYMDSRLAQTKLSKLFTWFIVQTRKRGVDMYVCTHHLSNVDIRLRRAVDTRGACRFFSEAPCKKCKGLRVYKGEKCPRCLGYGETGWARVNFLDRRSRRRYNVELFGPSYWGLYDTKERMPIQQKVLDGIETLEVV